jgi:hypothetical protein
MTESVLQDMLNLIKVHPHTDIDVGSFYHKYRNECKRLNVDPIKESYYFYRAAMSYKKNLWLTIGEDGKPHWTYKKR